MITTAHYVNDHAKAADNAKKIVKIDEALDGMKTVRLAICSAHSSLAIYDYHVVDCGPATSPRKARRDRSIQQRGVESPLLFPL